MADDRHNFLAFCVLVAAICYLATIAALLAYHGKYAEALGFGGLTTGLVGVLGTFKPRNSTSNADRVETVNQGTAATGQTTA